MIRMQRSEDEVDRANFVATYGALLFGVPSAGMDVKALAAMIGYLPARTTLNDLDDRIGHRLRHRQHKEFCEAYHFEDSILARFFELNETPTVQQVLPKISPFEVLVTLNFQDPMAETGWSRSGPPKMLVGFHSATMGRPWETSEEYIVGLPGDHSTLVKLPDHPPDAYHKIYNILEQFSQSAPGVVRSRFCRVETEAAGRGSVPQKYSVLPANEVRGLSIASHDTPKTALQTGHEEAGKCLKSRQSHDYLYSSKRSLARYPFRAWVTGSSASKKC